MNKREEVVDIPGFPGYFANRDGEVFSMKGSRGLRKMKQFPDDYGYFSVSLMRDGKRHQFKTHRIILTTFVGQKPPGMVCCHGIGGKSNNSIENLSWGTQKKNMGEDRVRDGTIVRGEMQWQSKLNELQVRIIRRVGNGLSNRILGEYFHVSGPTVNEILNRKAWGWL
jgi:hypothetical protein